MIPTIAPTLWVSAALNPETPPPSYKKKEDFGWGGGVLPGLGVTYHSYLDKYYN